MTCHAVHHVTQIYSHVTSRYYTGILIIGHVTQESTEIRSGSTAVGPKRTITCLKKLRSLA